MINCFIDTNVLLDWVLDRKPFNSEALLIKELAEKRIIEAEISSASLFTVTYFIRKTNTLAGTTRIIRAMISIFSLLPTTKSEVQTALNSYAVELEDAYQYFTAVSHPSIDYFVTRNEKHFHRIETKLPVVNPGEFLKIIAA